MFNISSSLLLLFMIIHVLLPVNSNSVLLIPFRTYFIFIVLPKLVILFTFKYHYSRKLFQNRLKSET